MKFLKAICRWIDQLNEWVGYVVAWVTFLVVIVVFVDVVMRYALNTSYVFVQELEWHLFSFIFLMGAGYTLLKDGHVRVDIFYQQASPRTRAWINFIGVIFFLFPGCYMIMATSWHFVYNSWAMMEGSPDPGGIPYRFIVKGTIMAGFVLITLQGISLGIKSFFGIRGREIRYGIDEQVLDRLLMRLKRKGVSAEMIEPEFRSLQNHSFKEKDTFINALKGRICKTGEDDMVKPEIVDMSAESEEIRIKLALVGRYRALILKEAEILVDAETP